MTVVAEKPKPRAPSAHRAGDPRTTQPLRPLVFFAGVLALAVFGGLLAVKTARDQASAPQPRGEAVGTSVPTDFGFLTVPYVQKLSGLTSRDVAGALHGVNGLVAAGNEQIQVALQLTSTRRDEVTSYRVDEFALLVGDGSKASAPASTTIHNGTLQPDASVTGHLGFVVPKDGSRLRLRYAPHKGRTVIVELGHADRARPGEKEPAHPHSGS